MYITSSSYSAVGVQVKWHDDLYWYKLDKVGHEGLSEMVASNILSQSNYAYYNDYFCDTLISPEGLKGKGCYSYNFLYDYEKFISVAKLFEYWNIDIDDMVDIATPVRDKIQILVDGVVKLTGLEDYGTYLSDTLYFDGYILNTDRHLNNFGVIWNKREDSYTYPPIFDNGMSLLLKKDTLDTEFIPIYAYIRDAHAKPFDTDFNNQSLIAEELYGRNLQINYDKDVLWKEMCETPYSEEQINKVMDILEYQDTVYFGEDNNSEGDE